MGREIERKFLVRGEGWREGAAALFIRQGYLSTDPGRVVRARIAGDRAFITVKGVAEGAGRDEFEYPIPVADAEAILDRICLRPLIEKTRHRVSFGGRAWEVDVFEGENRGLVIAEVELEGEDEPVEVPEWAGEEGTGDWRYENASLVSNPYGRWGR